MNRRTAKKVLKALAFSDRGYRKSTISKAMRRAGPVKENKQIFPFRFYKDAPFPIIIDPRLYIKHCYT